MADKEVGVLDRTDSCAMNHPHGRAAHSLEEQLILYYLTLK